jgi:hypothetical protein
MQLVVGHKARRGLLFLLLLWLPINLLLSTPHDRPRKPTTATAIISIMTAVSASPAGLGAMSPTTTYQEASFIDFFQLAGRLHSEHEHEDKHDPSSNPPMQTTSTKSSDQYININRSPESLQNSYVPIDETAIFYSGLDFTPLDSATISRVTSMSPEEALKAGLDLKKDGSGHHDCFGSHDRSIAPRDRSFSAPEGNIGLVSLNKKLVTETGSGVESSKSRAGKRVAKKPTAQEWVSDIDCVSDIFGSMVADGDRGGIHL